MCPEPHIFIRLLDGTLPAETSTRVRLHLDGCDNCRTTYDELVATHEQLAAWDVPPPPQDDFVSGVMRAAVRDRLELPRNRSELRRWRGYAAAIAAAIAFGVVTACLAPAPASTPSRSNVSAETVAVALGLDDYADRARVLSNVFDDQGPSADQEDPS